jgi:hypothetical protein
VRQSSSRSKADFDGLAEKIETEWYAVLSGERDESEGTKKKEGEITESEAEARRLLVSIDRSCPACGSSRCWECEYEVLRGRTKGSKVYADGNVTDDFVLPDDCGEGGGHDDSGGWE